MLLLASPIVPQWLLNEHWAPQHLTEIGESPKVLPPGGSRPRHSS
jgi:hypothetical protein